MNGATNPRAYVKKIQYPCETASIFQGVVFVICVTDATELFTAIENAIDFYLGYFPFCNQESVRDGIRYSFGGLYLRDTHILMEAV